MSDTLSNPADLDEALELALGRRAPYTQLGDWVLLSGVSAQARALYWALSAHINVTRDDTEVWPGLLTLARLLYLKKPEQVAAYMLELEVIGAVEVFRTTVGLISRNRYVIHQTPPPGHCLPESTAAFYALNRAPKGESDEARKEREARFDAWFDKVRAALKAHCDTVKGQRVAARKAKQPTPPVALFDAPRPPSPRTPKTGGTSRPAGTGKAPGRPVPPNSGVRTPNDGGLVPPQMGVEKDQEEQDQDSLSAGASDPAPEPPSSVPAARGERDSAPQDDDTPAAAVEAELVEHQEQAADTATALEAALDLVAQAYADAHRAANSGAAPAPSVAKLIRTDAGVLLGTGLPAEYVAARAAELPPKGWKNLVEHCARNPYQGPAGTGTGAASGPSRAELIAGCGRCDEFGQYERPDGRWVNCPHTDTAPAPQAEAAPAAAAVPSGRPAGLDEILAHIGGRADKGSTARRLDQDGRPRRATRAELAADQAAEETANRRAAEQAHNAQYDNHG